MQKITLQQARLNARLSLKESAECVGISVKTLKRWEENCGRSNSLLFFELLKLYGIHINHIHIGKESEWLAAHQETGRLQGLIAEEIEKVAVRIREKGYSLKSLFEECAEPEVCSNGKQTIHVEKMLLVMQALGRDTQGMEEFLSSMEKGKKNAITTGNSESAIA
ncbi:MAG: hypothetical protein K6T85_07765 [Gorillibacterium sp.]|nr:hypothetical protein [Gorillibacterium sp.]